MGMLDRFRRHRTAPDRPEGPPWDGGWRGVAPITPLLRRVDARVGPGLPFRDGLASWQDVTFGSPLGHSVDPAAPVGTMHGVIRYGTLGGAIPPAGGRLLLRSRRADTPGDAPWPPTTTAPPAEKGVASSGTPAPGTAPRASRPVRAATSKACGSATPGPANASSSAMPGDAPPLAIAPVPAGTPAAGDAATAAAISAPRGTAAPDTVSLPGHTAASGAISVPRGTASVPGSTAAPGDLVLRDSAAPHGTTAPDESVPRGVTPIQTSPAPGKPAGSGVPAVSPGASTVPEVRPEPPRRSAPAPGAPAAATRPGATTAVRPSALGRPLIVARRVATLPVRTLPAIQPPADVLPVAHRARPEPVGAAAPEASTVEPRQTARPLVPNDLATPSRPTPVRAAEDPFPRPLIADDPVHTSVSGTTVPETPASARRPSPTTRAGAVKPQTPGIGQPLASLPETAILPAGRQISAPPRGGPPPAVPAGPTPVVQRASTESSVIVPARMTRATPPPADRPLPLLAARQLIRRSDTSTSDSKVPHAVWQRKPGHVGNLVRPVERPSIRLGDGHGAEIVAMASMRPEHGVPQRPSPGSATRPPALPVAGHRTPAAAVSPTPVAAVRGTPVATVQRAPAVTDPSAFPTGAAAPTAFGQPTTVVTRSPATATTSRPPESTVNKSLDVDELARRLLEPVSRLLRSDLRQGRERAGRAHDRRR